MTWNCLKTPQCHRRGKVRCSESEAKSTNEKSEKSRPRPRAERNPTTSFFEAWKMGSTTWKAMFFQKAVLSCAVSFFEHRPFCCSNFIHMNFHLLNWMLSFYVIWRSDHQTFLSWSAQAPMGGSAAAPVTRTKFGSPVVVFFFVLFIFLILVSFLFLETVWWFLWVSESCMAWKQGL